MSPPELIVKAHILLTFTLLPYMASPPARTLNPSFVDVPLWPKYLSVEILNLIPLSEYAN